MNSTKDELIGMTIRPMEEELLMIFKLGGSSIKIKKGSSRREVSEALQKLARFLDPDHFQDTSEKLFQAIRLLAEMNMIINELEMNRDLAGSLFSWQDKFKAFNNGQEIKSFEWSEDQDLDPA